MFKRFLQAIKPWVRNYYLITGLAFLVWMIFFDSNNFINQYKSRQDLKELERQQEYYQSEIEKNKALIHDLTNKKDLRAAEKFARENYLMKKENEDIFLIVNE